MTLDLDRFHDFPPARRWHAKWVWAEGDPRTPNTYCLFRRELELTSVPPSVLAFITADTRYQLHINGQFVGRGAPQSQPYYQFYDQREVASYLRPGINCIGVIVSHTGNLPDTRGGLLAEFVDPAGNTLCATGADWRVCKAHAWAQKTFHIRTNQATPHQEFFDGRKMPRGWNIAGFDDASWLNAQVVCGRTSDQPPAVAPWVRLLPRDIPFMVEQMALPRRVDRVEECIDLANRHRSEDLSICLSTGGAPVRHSQCRGADQLLHEGGVAELCCSTEHLDHVFDGRYDPCIVLDFGKVVAAYVRIEVDGVDGAVLDIGYAERLIDGHFNNAIEGQFADRLIMSDGPQVYQPFTWKAFRYLKLRLRCCEKPIRLHSVRAMVTAYPFEERGGFHCDDQTLNAVFDISRYTLRLCANEFIMDTPWREQAQWLGDVAAVSVPGLYACFGDRQLTGKFFRQSAANPMPTGMLSNVSNTFYAVWEKTIPDYSLWWIMGLWGHYLYTGEERWVHECWPVVQRIFQGHMPYINRFGLIEDMPLWVFIDWAPVDKRGECATYNALFYGALEAIVNMAQLKQDAHTLDKATQLRAAIHESFQARFYDPKCECFADARIDDVLSPAISEHANVAAIRWGLCDDQTAAGIVRRFYEDRSTAFTEAQPFFTIVVLQALQRAGRMDLAIQLIRDRWGKRMIDRGATSTFEEWGMNGSWRDGPYNGFMRSLSHAWSACPAEFLIRNLMGLELLPPAPGNGCRVRLDPWPAPFDYQATYPTVQGPIRVTCRAGKIQIDKPLGVEIVV